MGDNKSHKRKVDFSSTNIDDVDKFYVVNESVDSGREAIINSVGAKRVNTHVSFPELSVVLPFLGVRDLCSILLYFISFISIYFLHSSSIFNLIRFFKIKFSYLFIDS